MVEMANYVCIYQGGVENYRTIGWRSWAGSSSKVWIYSREPTLRLLIEKKHQVIKVIFALSLVYLWSIFFLPSLISSSQRRSARTSRLYSRSLMYLWSILFPPSLISSLFYLFYFSNFSIWFTIHILFFRTYLQWAILTSEYCTSPSDKKT